MGEAPYRSSKINVLRFVARLLHNRQMLKPFSLIFFVVVMIWVGSILVTTKPTERMDRGCFPMEVLDRTLTSGLLLVNASWAPGGHELFQSWTAGCKFVVWKIFYESEWMDQNQINAAPGGAASTEDALRMQAERLKQGAKEAGGAVKKELIPTSQPGTAPAAKVEQSVNADPARSAGGQVAAQTAEQKAQAAGLGALAPSGSLANKAKSQEPANYFEAGK